MAARFNFNFSKKSGFTLIELLVVIAIISALATLLTSNFVGIRQRGRDAQRKSDLRQMQSALELYRADTGTYPITSAFPTCGSTFPTSGTTIYMKKIPCDPTTATSYVYTATPSGCDNSATFCTGYTIYSCIENTKDTDSDANQSRTPALQSGCTPASFTITNP